MKRILTLTRVIVLPVVILLMAQPQLTYSQTTPIRDNISNHMFWGNMIIRGKIIGKFGYQFDLDYRRQADPAHPADPNTTIGKNHSNIFKSPLQYAGKFWIHYQPDRNIRFSISPITWFGTWTVPVNGITYFQPEYRGSLQLTLNQAIGRLSLSHRYRYDLRFFGTRTRTDDPADFTGPIASYNFPRSGRQGRFRYQLRSMIPINHKSADEKQTFYIVTSGELMLRTGKNISNANLLDQYRLQINFGYKISDISRIEIGYLHQSAFRFNNIAKNNVDKNHILFTSLIFDNFNSLFKKKKKVEEIKSYFLRDDLYYN